VTELTRDMGDFEADARTMLYLIRKRLDESGGESGFLASGLTFCGLKPMRSIPFRVVCLTGLTSTAFPRQDTPPGFDLMAARPRPGDRSLREDDRYLFLESIISARDNLILTYPGLSQSDNNEAPPSVLVSELLDFLDKGCTVDGLKPSEAIVFKHKLQAFHPDYFSAGSPLFSYSAQNRDAALALFAEHRPRQFFPETDAPEDAQAEQEIEIDIEELTRFLAHPCRHLLRACASTRPGARTISWTRSPWPRPRALKPTAPCRTSCARPWTSPPPIWKGCSWPGSSCLRARPGPTRAGSSAPRSAPWPTRRGPSLATRKPCGST
jgi:exodeoxyribonuclease V gamma subunit